MSENVLSSMHVHFL